MVKNSAKATKATPKRIAAPPMDDAPKPPCDVSKLINHYRHQLHQHLRKRGDKTALCLLLTILTLEGIQVDQEALA